MTYDIIILNQITDTVMLYINCFKEGYTKLYYYTDPNEIHVLNLTSPRITIKELTEEEYVFYCENEKQEKTDPITISISTTNYDIFWNNLSSYSGVNNTEEILQEIKDPDYVISLYKMVLANKDKFADYEELLLSCVSFYNIRQESLNTVTVPDFTIKDNTITSVSGQKFNFVLYVYNSDAKKWDLIAKQSKKEINTYEFYGKPSLMYRICVLSDSGIMREYLYYQPSKTLSETILERQISAKQQLSEKTAEMMSRFDMTELLEDEYGQQVVCALQEIKPERYILSMPQVTYDKEDAWFYITFSDYTVLPAAGYNIYLAALEIDQAFNSKRVPHKILVPGKNFIMNPYACHMNYQEDYIFYFCDEDNNILSEPFLCGYNTDSDTSLYFSVSRKIDVEQYRRRLLNTFKEYDKKDWDSISLILDHYFTSEENLLRTISDYMLEEISRMDRLHYRIEYLMQLILLHQLQYYLPINQNFIKEQVYAEGYHKHVFPEADSLYIIRRGRINKNTLSWDYISCGSQVQELRTDQDEFLLLQAMDRSIINISPYAFYYNIYIGNTRYFYYPDLEVTVAHGLY